MSATVRELKTLQRPVLRKVTTSPADQRTTTSAAMLISGGSDTATTVTPETRQLRRASMRSRMPGKDSDRGAQGSEAIAEPRSEKKSRAESRRKHALDDASAKPGPIRQKSEEDESSKARTRVPHQVRGKHSSMPTVSMLDPDNEVQVLRALEELKAAAVVAKAERLRPRTDSPIYRKWEAAEKELQSTLTLESSHAMRRILSYCHQVSLKPGEEPASLRKAVMAARPRSNEIRADLSVRNILLEESRGEAETKVSAAFPDLLSLLVFLIDADREWRQESAAQGAD